jgi:hypothetical protein
MNRHPLRFLSKGALIVTVTRWPRLSAVRWKWQFSAALLP